MTKRTVSSTVQVSRQSTKEQGVFVSINVPRDATDEEAQMLMEEAALEKAFDMDFTNAKDTGNVEYFVS